MMLYDPQKPTRMFSGPRVILYGLILVLALSSMYMSGKQRPAWENCKESLVQQFFSDTCTPRNGFGNEIVIPASPGQNT